MRAIGVVLGVAGVCLGCVAAGPLSWGLGVCVAAAMIVGGVHLAGGAG